MTHKYVVNLRDTTALNVATINNRATHQPSITTGKKIKK